ncbi:uncharacterized protein LOC105195383 [Solenopsis invicta]|uniref:uncharacterized protein LOC105195383 n=1 Tax=Solenopsis invicta TaxID=13686 RepID=UPI00193E984D|nr:uncharacterized protein LOC105195383 [Solenopsis invicta]
MVKMKEKIHVKVKNNSQTIERILRPITCISWLLGVGIAHPRKCSKAITIIIRMIHMAVCSYVMICDTQLFFIRISLMDEKGDIFMYIYSLNRMMCYISIFYYIYYGIRQYNKWPELMDRLNELDQKIKKEISINDWPIKIIEALAIFTTFVFCSLWPTLQFLHYYILSYTIPESIIIEMLIYYFLAQSLINSFVFDVVIYVLYRRFQTLNKVIGHLDKLSDVQWIAFKIRRIRELHADICDLVSMLNDIHSLHLLFCSGHCFIMAIISLFNLILLIKHVKWLTLTNDFLYILYSMQFYLICWICTLACQEANSTGKIIHKIILNCKPMNLGKHEASNQSSLEVRSSLEVSNSEQNSNWKSSHNPFVMENFLRRNLDLECVRKEVNDFSIQLQQNRITFSAYDFFEINNASYGCFVGVVVTYPIIIIQFIYTVNKW